MIQARLIARVVGVPAVLLGTLWTFVRLAYAPIPDWLKLIAFILIAALFMLLGLRMYYGSDQGGTDVHVDLGDRKYSAVNVPLAAISILDRALSAWARRRPLPPARGRVEGTPALERNLIPGSDNAEALNEVPEGAQGLVPKSDVAR
jgi:hypothetical protein